MLLPKQEAPLLAIAASPYAGKGKGINSKNDVRSDLAKEEDQDEEKPHNTSKSPSITSRQPLKRTDSLDPETRCRGITARGKSCRNPSPHAARSYRPSKGTTAAAVPADEDYFCHHHKSQAAARRPAAAVDDSPSSSTTTTTTTVTTSALADDEDEEQQPASTARLPPQSESSPSTTPRKSTSGRALVTPPATPPGSLADRLGLLEIPVPHIPPAQQQKTGQQGHGKNNTSPSSPTIRKCHSLPLPGHASFSLFSRRNTTSGIPRTSSSTMSSLIQTMMTFIQAVLPETSPTSPTKAALSQVLAHLAKSLASPSHNDTKPGFIYILRPFPSPSSSSHKMRIKIGRTNNIDRRLAEHRRQCAYEPELLACFPVPERRVRLVESLIHAALRGLREEEKEQRCKGCGRKHREWYEVERSREAVGVVENVVSFFVGWVGDFMSAAQGVENGE